VPRVGVTTSQRTIEITPGTSREEIYTAAVDHAVRGMGAAPGGPAITLFWSLEPADLV